MSCAGEETSWQVILEGVPQKKDLKTALAKWKITVDKSDREGDYALHYAARRDLDQLIKTLLDAGAQIDARDKRGRTALHVLLETVEVDGLRSLEMLLSRGADPATQDTYGFPAFFACFRIRSLYMKMIERFEKEGSDWANLSYQIKCPLTSLFAAHRGEIYIGNTFHTIDHAFTTNSIEIILLALKKKGRCNLALDIDGKTVHERLNAIRFLENPDEEDVEKWKFTQLTDSYLAQHYPYLGIKEEQEQEDPTTA